MRRQYRSFDFLLAALVCGLGIFGIVVIGSATLGTLGGDGVDFYERQKLWFASGLVLMVAAAFIDYHFISKFYIAFYVLNIALLILVFFLGDQDLTGTARWIRFGQGSGGVSIQPSEFSKIFMIIFLATLFERKQEFVNRLPMLLFILISAALPVVLIMMQPSLSAAIVVFAVSIAIMYVGMVSYKYIITAFGLIGPIALFTYIDLTLPKHILIDKIISGYQIKRLLLWINNDQSDPKFYQTLQSIKAIASGQLQGKGLGDGMIVVPSAHNDFIFAVISEEFGFIGCMVVLGVLFLVILKCLLIAQKAVDISGRLIAVGAATMICFQTFVNVGVATGLLPNTGASLPFISSGGSSMWVCMVAVGLCINVGMSRNKSFFEG